MLKQVALGGDKFRLHLFPKGLLLGSDIYRSRSDIFILRNLAENMDDLLVLALEHESSGPPLVRWLPVMAFLCPCSFGNSRGWRFRSINTVGSTSS